jgi:hypothetical protein
VSCVFQERAAAAPFQLACLHREINIVMILPTFAILKRIRFHPFSGLVHGFIIVFFGILDDK